MNESSTRPEDPSQLRELVSERYGKIAERASDDPGAAEAARRVGYAAEQLDAIPEGIHFVAKPFTLDTLTARVREVLGQAGKKKS